MKYSSDTDPTLNPTNQMYGLELRIKKIRKNAFQGMQGRLKGMKSGFTAIILEILPAKRQNERFLYAWEAALPPEYDDMGNIIKNHPPEVIIEFEERPFGVARCFMMSKDNDSPEYPYLFLGSVGMEKKITTYYKNGDLIKALALPSTDDGVGDAAIDPDYDMSLYE